MPTTNPEQFERWWPIVLRLSGLIIALYETIIEGTDRPSLLILAAGMMGLPEIIKAQRKSNGGGK